MIESPPVTIKKGRKSTVTVWEFHSHCLRCGHKWTSRRAAPPTRCARCKSANFDRAARTYTRRK